MEHGTGQALGPGFALAPGLVRSARIARYGGAAVLNVLRDRFYMVRNDFSHALATVRGSAAGNRGSWSAQGLLPARHVCHGGQVGAGQ